MNPKYSIRVIHAGQAQRAQIVRSGAGASGQALVLVAEKGSNYQILDVLTQESPSKLSVARSGQDLHLTLPEGDPSAPDIVIKGYFDVQSVGVFGRTGAGDWLVYDTTGFSLSALASDNGISAASLGDGQVASATLASPSSGSWLEGSRGWMALGLGAAGVAALAVGKSSSSNAGASEFAKISDYASHKSVSAPLVADYQKAGITGVDLTDLAAVNSAISATPLDASNKANVQTVVDAYVKILAEANGVKPDATPGVDPSLTDYQNLGVSLGAQATNANALALFNDAVKGVTSDHCDSVTKLQAIVTVVQKIMSIAAGDVPSAALTTNDLLLLGITQAELDTVHANTNLSSIASAIGAGAADGSGVATVAQLQTIMAAYDKILIEANGSAPDANVSSNPTVADFAAVGANIGQAASSDTALKMLDDVIGGLPTTGVSTVGEINAIAATLDKISTIAAKATGDTTAATLSVTELQALGLSGFGSTGAENQQVASLLSTTIRDLAPSDVDTLAKLQALVSLEVLRVWAGDTAVPHSATQPSAADYTNMGVTHVDAMGVASALTTTDVAALNSFAGNLSDAKLSSLVEVQQIGDALFKVLNEANGTAPDANPAVNPSAADYASLGVSGHAGTSGDVLQTVSALLLTDVVSTKTSTQVDTATALNALSSAVDHVIDTAAGTAALGTLTLADLTALGVVGGTAGDQTAIFTAIAATAHDGTAVDTLSGLQSVVSLARVSHYADNINVATGGSNEGGLPTLADYQSILDVKTAVVAANVDAYNSAVAAKGSGLAVDTGAELLAVVQGYNAILAETNGAAANPTAPHPSLADFAAVGVTIGAVSTVPASNSLTLTNEAIGSKSASGVNTVAELVSIESAVVKVMGLAAINKTSGGSAADALSVGGFTTSDLANLGLDVSLLTNSSISDAARVHRLDQVRDLLIYSDNTGAEAVHLSQLQTWINTTYSITI